MSIQGPKPVETLPAGRAIPDPDESVREEIRAVLAEHDRLWQALDFAGVASLWDLEEGVPIYVGDEYAAPVVGWQDLNRNFGRLGGRLREAAMRSTLLEAHRAGSDLAIAVYLLEWSLATVESPERRSGQRWVSAVLRRVGDEWRFIHNAESPAYHVDRADMGSGEAADV